MSKLTLALFALCLPLQAHGQDKAQLERAWAEGKASFYANITAVEPVMKAFTTETGGRRDTGLVNANCPTEPKTMTLPRQITFRDLVPLPSLEPEIRHRADKLDQWTPDVMSCDVVVEAAGASTRWRMR